jgi:hypothetical protein
MFPEGNAANPVKCDSPMQIVMAIWPLFKNWNLRGWVWQHTDDYNGCLVRYKFKKNAPKGPILSATPDQITQQAKNSLQRTP